MPRPSRVRWNHAIAALARHRSIAAHELGPGPARAPAPVGTPVPVPPATPGAARRVAWRAPAIVSRGPALRPAPAPPATAPGRWHVRRGPAPR